MWRRPDPTAARAALGALVLFAGAQGCRCGGAAREEPPPAPTFSIVGTAVASDAGAARDGAVAGDPDCDQGAPKKGKSIGHTSVVFKLELDNGKTIVFKPHTHRGPGRYKGEIAAYRLARALDLPNVPPSCFRRFPKADLARALGAEAAKLFEEEAIVEDGTVRGAATPWIEGYEVLPLEKDPLFSQMQGWLKRGAEIPPDKKTLAAEASALIAFDYVTGNWDRWSGANVATAKGRMLFVDNDGAFFANPPVVALKRNEKLASAVERWPRGLSERLASTTEPDLVRIFGEEEPGKPLLSPTALAGVEARRRSLVALMRARVDDAGEDETLYFP